jgi:LysR family hydrogen peroxide-inducible transcriptional activator
MNVTLRQLRYFRALARERHFGRAAEAVAVSQPALSAQIRQMEAALGGPLLNRGLPELPLTPLGRAVLRHAERVLAEMRGLEEAAREARGGGLEVTLGIIPTVAPYLAPHLLPLTHRAGGRLIIREAVTATLMAELAEGALDAALVALPVAGRDLVIEPVFEDRFLLARPLADTTPPPARPEDVDPERLLLLDEDHCLAGQALAACGLARETGWRRFGAASLVTLARLVASAQGVTLLPETAAGVEGQGMRLSRFAAPEPGRTLALVRLGQGGAPPWFARLAALIRDAAGMIPRPEVPMFARSALEGRMA